MHDNSVLLALRGAKLTLMRCEREKLPGVRTSLDTSRRAQITLDQVERATLHQLGIVSIRDISIRRVVELAATVDRGGERQYSRADIAGILQITERTVTRKLTAGLKAVESWLFHNVSRETKIQI